MAEAHGKRARTGLGRVWTGPVAGLGVLILLGVAYFLVTRPSPPPKATPYLLHVTTDQIAALEFHATGKTLTLYAKPGTAGAVNWAVGSPTGTAADNTLVQSFVGSLVTLQASRKLTASPTASALQSYGLSPVASSLVIVRNTGQPPIELDVGQTAPTGEYYAQVKGDPAVYLIAGTVPGEISADPNAWLPLPSNSASSSASASVPLPSGTVSSSTSASAAPASSSASGG